MLSQSDHSKLISTYYNSLIHTTTKRLEQTAADWRWALPELTVQVWQEVLPLQSPMVISSQDRALHTKFLHRSYFTPYVLFQMGRLASPNCTKCTGNVGSFYHMVWDCPCIRAYWSTITAFVTTVLQAPNICNPLCCLLGYVEEDTLPARKKILLRLLVFYAPKKYTFNLSHQLLPPFPFSSL